MEKANKRTGGGVSLKSIILNNKALVILCVIIIVVGIATKGLFFTPNNLKNVVRQVCASIVLGCGFTLILASGGIDLSVGSMVSLLSVIVAKFSLIQGIPFVVVIVFALLMGAFVGFFNGSIVNGLGLPAFVVTIGTKSVFEGVTNIIANNASVTGIPDAFRFLGQGYVVGIPFPIFIMVFMVLLSWFVINKTEFGRYSLATGGNAVAARACGVNIKKISTMAYIWMGMCASITALILTGRSASGQTGAGSGMEMDIIAAVVIGGTSMTGGVARVVGTLFGCLMIGVINNGLNLMGVDANYQTIAKGTLIILAIVLDAYGAKALSIKKKK